MRSIAKCILILLAALTLGRAGAAFAASDSTAVQTAQPDIEAFVREGCLHCAKAEEFLAVLQREQPALRVAIRDVGREPAALEKLRGLAEQHGEKAVRVPAFEVGGQLIVGYSEEANTGRLIRDSLTQTRHAPQGGAAALSCGAEVTPSCTGASPKPETFAVEFLGRKLSLEQVGLPLFTVVLGLLDGFNPCSMWVLILMISLLAPLNDRPRMLAIAGTFVAVQGIAYFVFMAAWLNLFLLVGLSRTSEVIIAILALVAGAINLKDFWRFGQGISLSIPASAKPGIYARMRRVMQADNLIAALLGTVLLGVLVQVVELMCTSGFPALFTRILTLQRLDDLSYYAYLILYDLAYMLDDMIVLAIGVVTLSQHRLQEREGRWLKLVSGVVMVGLGVYLLLIPHWTP
ncbi:MAG TPA: NrdH-redoxin [Gallionella sp.]|nr:NrdH-redoxin [Gallionella sp.]